VWWWWWRRSSGEVVVLQPWLTMLSEVVVLINWIRTSFFDVRKKSRGKAAWSFNRNSLAARLGAPEVGGLIEHCWKSSTDTHSLESPPHNAPKKDGCTVYVAFLFSFLFFLFVTI
jgi:hypothetical protein